MEEWNGIWNEKFLVRDECKMQEILQYGIWKNRLPFHSIACPGCEYAYQLQSHWFDPTRNRTRVYRSTTTPCSISKTGVGNFSSRRAICGKMKSLASRNVK